MPFFKPSKMFFGWWIAIVTGIVSGFGAIFLLQGASVFFKPIASELGLTRAALSVATGISTLVTGATFPLAGWLADKFGPRWIVVSGAVLAAAGMVSMQFVSSAWTYYLVYGFLITFGFTLGLTIAVDTMLTNWFVRKRGLAISVRFGIWGVIVVIGLPLMSWLLEHQTWHAIYLVSGLILLAAVPVLFLITRSKRPEYQGLLPDGAVLPAGMTVDASNLLNQGRDYAAAVQETEFTFGQAARTSAFWIMNLVLVIQTVVWTGFMLHVIPFLTDRGIDPVVAGSMLAMMTFFSLPSKVFGSLLADRVKKPHLKYLLAGAAFLPFTGLMVIFFSPTSAGVFILLVLYGLGSGAYVPVDILIRGRFFGRKAYGAIQGISALIPAPLAFFAPIYMGWIYDTTGKYDTAFAIFAGLTGLGALVMCMARVPGNQVSAPMRNSTLIE